MTEQQYVVVEQQVIHATIHTVAINGPFDTFGEALTYSESLDRIPNTTAFIFPLVPPPHKRCICNTQG